MIEYQKEADYVQAENFRRKFEECKEGLKNKNLSDTRNKHDRELNDLEKARQEELFHFNKYWDHKMNEFNNESKRVLR